VRLSSGKDQLRKKIEIIPSKVIQTLQKQSWPGNFRELENVNERAVINTRGPKLQLAEKLMTPLAVDLANNQRVSLEEVEQDHIVILH